MSYGPQPGYPPPPQYGPQHAPQFGPHYASEYGPPPGYPGYGPPQRPGTAAAYVCAGLFLICGVLALITAIVGWDGTATNVDMLVALVGAAFTEDVTGNVDFAVSATMTVACSTLVFALVLLTRLDAVRWLLGVVGGLVTVYYLYAIIKLLADGGAEFVALVLVSFLLWTAATVVALLPATGRAMRGFQRRLAHYPPRQPMGGPY